MILVPHRDDLKVAPVKKPPESPFRLRLKLAKDEVNATWGQVLGAKEYVLYRRKAGTSPWKGSIADRSSPSVISPPTLQPSRPIRASRPRHGVNLRNHPPSMSMPSQQSMAWGKVPSQNVATTDPANWRNWYPDVPLHFIRRSAYWLPPDVKPEQVPPADYPQ